MPSSTTGTRRFGLRQAGIVRRHRDARVRARTDARRQRLGRGRRRAWHAAICPESSAASRSASTTWPPRAALMTHGALRQLPPATRASTMPCGLRRQRQQADQDLGAVQERRAAASSPWKLFTPGQRFRRAAPARDIEAERSSQLAAASLPSTPRPRMPTLRSRASGIEQLAPHALRAAAPRAPAAAVIAQHVLAPRTRSCRAVRPSSTSRTIGTLSGSVSVLQQVIDAGTEPEDRLQVGIAREIARLVPPEPAT